MVESCVTLYKECVLCVDLKSKMAATTQQNLTWNTKVCVLCVDSKSKMAPTTEQKLT